MGAPHGSPLERILRRIEVGTVDHPEVRAARSPNLDLIARDPCWISGLSSRADGYRQVRVGDRRLYAHRVTYEALVGPIPDGMELDHLCRVRPCCNPAHGDPVPRRENVLRGTSPAARHAVKTHCPRGHELSEGNLVPSMLRNKNRSCLTCSRLRANERYARQRRERQAAAAAD